MSETTDRAIRKLRKAAAKPKGRVTMTDIARAAGCSQATVSFVLNNSPGIRLSRQTRERVIEAARALGYSAPAVSALKPPAAFQGGVDVSALAGNGRLV